MTPTPICRTRVFRVPSASGSSLVLEHEGRNFDLSHGFDRARHGDLLQLVERGFFDNFHTLEQTAHARRWTAPPPSELLTPLEPRQIGKILALCLPPRELFEQQAAGTGRDWFNNRSPASLAASGALVHLPEPAEDGAEETQILRHETFLAVVLSRRAREVTLQEAGACIAGYMVAADFTRRSLDGRQRATWFGRSPAGTLAIGPAFVPRSAFDLANVTIGARRHRGGASEPARIVRTDALAIDVPLAVAALSRLAILHAGDVLLIPTGVGMGTVESGDDVRCWIEGIGELATSVRRRTRLRQEA